MMADYTELVKRLNAHSAEHENHGGITAEAADAIEELQHTVEHYKGCSDDWYKEACDYKAMLPRWIPATERLPETYTWVLVYAEKHEVAFDAYYDGTQWKDALLNGLVVSHWMPLPEPPKEERNCDS